MKKSEPDRQYTEEFRQSAVKQVIDGGRSIAQVARALEMSKGTLGNWVSRSRRGEVLSKQSVGRPVSELEAEVSRLRAENFRLKLEKEILKSGGVLREGVDVKYAWIWARREQYSIPMMCELLSVSRSGLYQAMGAHGEGYWR